MEKLQTLTTAQVRQKLAGLINPQCNKELWGDKVAKLLAIEFCSVLPMVFGSQLERVTLWEKIATAINSACAKVTNGDVDMFVSCVLESIKAETSKVLCCDEFSDCLLRLHQLPEDERQDWIRYLATHLIPVLVHAKAAHLKRIGGAK